MDTLFCHSDRVPVGVLPNHLAGLAKSGVPVVALLHKGRKWNEVGLTIPLCDFGVKGGVLFYQAYYLGDHDPLVLAVHLIEAIWLVFGDVGVEPHPHVPLLVDADVLLHDLEVA